MILTQVQKIHPILGKSICDYSFGLVEPELLRFCIKENSKITDELILVALV